MFFRIAKILTVLRCRHLVALLLFPAPLTCNPLTAIAGPVTASESEVKSAYIYNLFHFVEWPEESRADWQVCLFPDDPLYTHLNRLNGKIVADRTIQVRQTASPAEWQQCHLLVVPKKIEAAQKRQVFALRNKPILTITDGEEDSAPHTIMFFYREKAHIRMGIHYPRLKASDISVSARLLKIFKVRNMQGGLEP